MMKISYMNVYIVNLKSNLHLLIKKPKVECMDFFNGIIRYGVRISGSAFILGDVILGVNVNGTKLSTIKK